MFACVKKSGWREREVDEEPDQEERARPRSGSPADQHAGALVARRRSAAAAIARTRRCRHAHWCPPAKWAIRASVASSRDELGGDPAAEHDEDAVAERQQLRVLGGGDEDPDAAARAASRAAGRSRPSRRRRRRASARRASARAARVASHLPSTTFCWLPPRQRRDRRARRARTIAQPSIGAAHDRAARAGRPADEAGASRAVEAIDRGSRGRSSRARARPLAVRGHEARARRGSPARGAAERDRPAVDLDLPAGRVRAPKSASSSSLRPAPTRPARPTISPGARRRVDTSANAPRERRARGRAGTTLAGARAARPAADSLELAADHQRGSASAGRVGDRRRRRRCAPSRSTVTRSASAKTSFSRCETKIDGDACVPQPPHEPNSASTSSSVSELVGSSRISDARVDRERAGDLDHLLLVGPKPARRAATGRRRARAGRAPRARGGACRASRCRPTPRGPCGGRGRRSRRPRGRARASSPASPSRSPGASASRRVAERRPAARRA